MVNKNAEGTSFAEEESSSDGDLGQTAMGRRAIRQRGRDRA